MPYVLGIDFGGTKMLAGVIDTENGQILSTARKRTRVERGSDEVLKRLLQVCKEALDASGRQANDLSGVGIGVAGQVDAAKNAFVRAPNLPVGLFGSAIPDAVCDELHVPVLLFNDVAAAAAGEAGFGAASGHPDFVCVFSGTGIGGAVYQHGKPYTGATNTAGELGHMVIDYGGRLCGCGGRGHLEAYASRTAVVRTVLGALKLGRSSSLAEVDPNPDPDNVHNSPIRSKALGQAVRDGDALARELVESAAHYMGAGLVSIINFYNPPRIILGGGIVQEVDLYLRVAGTHAQEEALQVPRQRVDIVKAALGDNSGIVGAALLAARRR